MKNTISMLRGFCVGDIVYHKRTNKNESSISKKRSGIIVELNKQTGMGFQMITVMWNDSQEIDIIGENHLHKFNEA